MSVENSDVQRAFRLHEKEGRPKRADKLGTPTDAWGVK